MKKRKKRYKKLVKRKRQRDKMLTKHHILPRSRGGSNDDRNIVRLPAKFHSLWHQLFVNMTVQEVHDFIDLIMMGYISWRPEDLKTARGVVMTAQEVQDEEEFKQAS